MQEWVELLGLLGDLPFPQSLLALQILQQHAANEVKKRATRFGTENIYNTVQ